MPGSGTTRFTSDACAARPGPGWLRRRRTDALARFEEAALPSESEEVWRYSRIDSLDLDSLAPLDGRIAPPAVAVELSDAASAKGVRVLQPVREDGDDAPGREQFGTVAHAGDALTDLAEAFLDDLIVIEIPAGVDVVDPVRVSTVLEGAMHARAYFPRVLVLAGESSRCTVVESIRAQGAGGKGRAGDTADDVPPGSLVVPVTEIVVEDGAHLSHVSIQDLSARAWYIGYQASRVGRDASFTSFSAALGSDYARVRTDCEAAGQGCETTLLAAYLATATQMHDFRTLQDHRAPHTRSDLYYKGAVADEAWSVYSGMIRVAKGAVKTAAFQENRNLVLSDGAHAESVPNLDIQENDVKCSHASAVGPVDPDHAYYLESRGIEPTEARHLVVEGFFEEIIGRAPLGATEARGVRRSFVDKLSSAVRAS